MAQQAIEAAIAPERVLLRLPSFVAAALVAAETDGVASSWERFRLVTWPLLGPTTLFVVTITMIRGVRTFDSVAVLTQGGPNRASEVLLYTMYTEGFTYFRLGYSAAITLVFLLIVLALMLLQTRVLDKRVHYG